MKLKAPQQRECDFSTTLYRLSTQDASTEDSDQNISYVMAIYPGL